MFSIVSFGKIHFFFDLKDWLVLMDDIIYFFKIFVLPMDGFLGILCLLLCKTAFNVIKTGIQLKEVSERQFKQHQNFSCAEKARQIIYNIIFTGHIIVIVMLTILAPTSLTVIDTFFFYTLDIPEMTTTLEICVITDLFCLVH